MTVHDAPTGTGFAGGAWDGLAEELRALRTAAGEPSYAEIARRVSRRRQEAGLSEEAARVARTTLYDVFRDGRTRVNIELVREVAAVLGAQPDSVDTWVARCRGLPVGGPAEHRRDATAGRDAQPQTAARRDVLLLMAGCVLVNLAGRAFVDLLDLPIYLDMTGTAIAALALGPWRGAAVGATTNVVGVLSSGAISLPFALVNVAGALVWGYGVRRWRLGRSLPRFLSLNLLVALACTLVAVPILVLAFGGSAGHGQDTLTATFVDLTHVLSVSVGLSNVLTSTADKVISGFVALVAISALPAALRHGLDLALPTAPPPS